MKRKSIVYLLALTLLAMVVLGGCAAPATLPVVEEPEIIEPVVEPAIEEPVVEEPVIEVPVIVDIDTPVSDFLAGMEAYNTITPTDVNEQLIDGTEIFLLDVRETAELEEKGYIEGAVHIPLRELGQHIDLLPANDDYIVVYCGSGWRATLGMTALGTLGFSNVRTMVGGSFGGWVEAGYPIAEPGLPPAPEALNEAVVDEALLAEVDTALQNLPEGWGVLEPAALNEEIIDGAELFILDVRKQGELDEFGWIEGSTLITLETLVENIDLLPAEKDTPIVVYCAAGTRGNIAAMLLRIYGYEDVRNIKGGFTAWSGAGLPIEGGYDLDLAVETFLAGMEAYNTITPIDVNEQLIDGTEIFLLDVRETAELEEKGYIEGAVHIPLRELGAKTNLLPATDAYIVVYCGSGWRATLGMTALGTLGFSNVRTMVGGSFGGWVEAGYPIAEPGLPPAPEVLEQAVLDPIAVKKVNAALASLPEGWGVLEPAALNEEIIDGAELALVDVRKVTELEEAGMIEGATLISLEQFVANKELWPALDADVVVYCAAGTRGNIAAMILRIYGYKDVRNLKGGFTAWADAGLPVVAYVN